MENTRLYRWMKQLGFTDYDAFFEHSIKDVGAFWDEAVQAMDVEWFQPYDDVLDLSKGVQWPAWFQGGRLNVTHAAVDRWREDRTMKDAAAVIWEGEDGDVRTYSYKALSDWVNRVALGLREQGIERGDRVVLYMPMIPETVAAMLALSKIGAVFTPAFSGYGAEAVAKRIEAAGAKMLITADGFYRRGKEIPMKEEADKAAKLAGGLEKVVVVARTGREIPWDDTCDVRWSAVEKDGAFFQAEAMKSDDPFMLIYTSGTTGRPKGIVHTHSGFPIKAAFDAGFCMDLRANDTLFWITDMGWMMGPFLVYGALLNQAKMVVYEGSPDYPNPDRVWRLVEQHRVTHLGISPTLIRALMKKESHWYENCDLSSLRGIGSTGEPWNPGPWHWLFEKIGQARVPIFNYSGGTEISGGILGNVPVKPIAPVGFNAALPGMDADVYNADGEPVRGEVGELVLRQPWVGMANGFWGEPERYENTYWSRWENTWVHGDWVEIDEEGFWYITGRSDDTLKVAGKRLGPAEMESVLVKHDAVVEAATVGVPDDVKGEAAVCFVVLVGGSERGERLEQELTALVAENLGKALKPKAIHFVGDLPKTRNAKVMRRVIRAAYLGEETGDLSALENPDAVEAIRAINGR
ncbi:MAG TPA: AMP-binding protein [Bacillales bacterium]|nr:AMP-binding protein [Bacillales bacterium]